MYKFPVQKNNRCLTSVLGCLKFRMNPDLVHIHAVQRLYCDLSCVQNISHTLIFEIAFLLDQLLHHDGTGF